MVVPVIIANSSAHTLLRLAVPVSRWTMDEAIESRQCQSHKSLGDPLLECFKKGCVFYMFLHYIITPILKHL